MMRCQSCGAAHPLNTLFCDECGFQLSGARQDTPFDRHPTPLPEPVNLAERRAAGGAADFGPAAGRDTASSRARGGAADFGPAAGRDTASSRARGGAAGEEPAAPRTRTTSLGSSAPSSLPERPAPVRSDDASPFVVRLATRDAETRYECPLLTELLIGRAGHGGIQPDIDLTDLNAVEQGVSRRHARIVRAGGGAALEDLNSLNGTFIGGHRLTPGHPEVIRPGDELQFGKLILVVSR